MGWILFGAGKYGKEAIRFLGSQNIEMVLDNDVKKKGSFLEGVQICLFDDVRDLLKDRKIVITVASEKANEIIAQLKRFGICDYIRFKDLKTEITKERIINRPDYIRVYYKAIQWIINNSIKNEGIIVATSNKKSYPEVTGYFIPSLLKWGYRDLALQYAKWLCSIQKDDGSWFDSDDKDAYVFDTAQVIKGLLAVRAILPEVDKSILKGCDWLLSRIDDKGCLVTPSKALWGDNRDVCDEIIHLYCISPLFEAGRVFNKNNYVENAVRIKKYYLDEYHEKIMNFSLLSHFYAYLMEALLDLGETEMARNAMERIAKYQDESGAVPAYNNVHWVCSTGIFQLALVWFRLGDFDRGNRAFQYACKLQNDSGGWFGSYLNAEHPEEDNDYFSDGEISWANKYYLDALYFRCICEFNRPNDQFLPKIDKEDGRYCLIKDEILNSTCSGDSILDIGCGKGRYLINLLEDVPNRDYNASDLSVGVMKNIIDTGIVCRQGSLTNIPWEDATFELVYCCEALEHAIDIENAIGEMLRVTKHGGKIIIIDKPIEKLGSLDITEYEQWLDTNVVISALSKRCIKTDVIKDIPYEGRNDGLFYAWVGIVD